MTFVLEARELHFDAVSDASAALLDHLIASHNLGHLPTWDRCMLATVLPVVLQRRQAIADAVALSLAAADDTAAPSHSTVQDDGGDVADASQSPHRIHTVPSTNPAHAATSASSSAAAAVGSAASPSLALATTADIQTALGIVHQLDELEVVYDSILATRQEHRAATAAEPPSRQPARSFPKTSEEIIMEQLLQERFSDTAPYLPESSSSSAADDDDGDAEGSGEYVDVAMCFTVKGESLGIGSAAVFGGHGYHP